MSLSGLTRQSILYLPASQQVANAGEIKFLGNCPRSEPLGEVSSARSVLDFFIGLFMKKIWCVLITFVLAALASALDFAVGARGNFNMNLGTSAGENGVSGMKRYDSSPIVLGGGFGVWGHIGFFDFAGMTLGATLEFGMNFHNGKSHKRNLADEQWTMGTYYDATIDIPVMVALRIPIGKRMKFDFGVGPNFSIPFDGTLRIDFSNGDSITESLDKYVEVTYYMNFGMVFDAGFGYKIGHGHLIFDLRYFLDFTPTTYKKTYKKGGVEVSDDMEMFYRRSLAIGVGYEFSF